MNSLRRNPLVIIAVAALGVGLLAFAFGALSGPSRALPVGSIGSPPSATGSPGAPTATPLLEQKTFAPTAAGAVCRGAVFWVRWTTTLPPGDFVEFAFRGPGLPPRDVLTVSPDRTLSKRYSVPPQKGTLVWSWVATRVNGRPLTGRLPGGDAVANC